jgi:hypothetical protein
LGAVTVFLFSAFSLMDHHDLVNRPPWADKLVLSTAIFVATLAAVDVSRCVGKRMGCSGSIKRTVEFGLDAK